MTSRLTSTRHLNTTTRPASTPAFAMNQHAFESMLQSIREEVTMTTCTEPAGQEPAYDDPIPDTPTAHEVMLSQTGHCPWCGATS